MRRGWRPLAGLICEIVNSVRQGKFYICQGKIREFQKPMAVATMLKVRTTQSACLYI